MTKPASDVVPIKSEGDGLSVANFNPKRDSLVTAMIFDPALNERVNGLVANLVNSPSAPKHVRGNHPLGLWVVEMHLKTTVPIMALTQGVFDPGGGILGMTAQLCLTILQGSGSVVGEPEYELLGDWSKVKGKHKQIEKDKDGRKTKFCVPTYEDKDEKGLGMRVKIQWADREGPDVYPKSFDEDGKQDAYWMTDCYPRNSTLWATDPLQQMKNYSLRRVSRTARPAVLNGLQIIDDDFVPMGPANARTVGSSSTSPITADEALEALADDDDGFDDFGDDPAEGNNDEGHKTVLVWKDFENPSCRVPADDLETEMFDAINGAKDAEHLKLVVDHNVAVVKANMDKAGLTKLDKERSKRAEELARK